MSDPLANLLPGWLTNQLGEANELREWEVNGLTIAADPVGGYWAAAWGADHSLIFERDFATAKECMEFVKVQIENERSAKREQRELEEALEAAQ